ncbi:MAG: JAB domain-containing protein [Alistipes senegalensis]|nr:JAB domain-containing protein [Bacteroides cellulosilyticus]MCM1351426.1 JAB domain-containing protein [Alistipes senegalensis]
MDSINDKIALHGAEALSDTELLTVLTGDEAVAKALLKEAGGSLVRLNALDQSRLRMVGGLGLRRARLLAAAAEYGRRTVAKQPVEADRIIRESNDIVRIFRPQLEGLPHEECWAVYLTGSNRIIEQRRISQGGLQATVVDARLVVKRALELLAANMILIHNHPSGAAEPSAEDRTMTEKIVQAAALFNIRVLDHLIISREGEYSFRRTGLIA